MRAGGFSTGGGAAAGGAASTGSKSMRAGGFSTGDDGAAVHTRDVAAPAAGPSEAGSRGQ